jgi:alanyl-tRNA synthetase
VRRIEVGEFSRELCGGTHVQRTGQIGAFVLATENGIAAGTRRIEAFTGRGSVREARRALRSVGQLQRQLPGTGEVVERVEALQQELVRLRKQIQELKSRGPGDALAGLLSGAERTPSGTMLVGTMEAEDGADLRALGDRIRERLQSGAALVAVRVGKKTTLLALSTDDLVQSGRLKADDLVRAAASAVGGSGGGKPHLAMAGVGDPAMVDTALNAGRVWMERALGA